MPKTVICTGAASGIGLATVHGLIDAGYNVLGVDISAAPQEPASGLSFFQIDLTKPDAAASVISAAKAAFEGPLYGLINVAGIMDSMQGVDCFDDGQWDRCLAINLTAPVKLMRAFVNALRTEKLPGSIVNVSSKAGMSGSAAGIAYTSSKAGLIGATKSVAFRFKGEGIRCNAICPGAVPETNIAQSMDQRLMDQESMKPLLEFRAVSQPAELYLQPADIASLLVYLAGEGSKGITGAVVPIDSGWSTY